MKTLYLDVFSGIAGDMFIAALLDLGVDQHEFERELKKIKFEGYHLHISRQQKSSISGLKFDVHLENGASHQSAHDHGHRHEHHHDHHHDHAHDHTHDKNRNFTEITELISQSDLSPWVKEKSISVFRRIAVAEGKIHGVPAKAVHFHEVGAVDSIVDIVGAAVALELLGRPRVLASRVIDGTGWIDCAHGRFPVPAPATLAILGERGIGLTQCDEPHEMVTPTGAALLAEFVESFGPMENLVAGKIGFGLGFRENKTRPNVLRAVLGEASPLTGPADASPQPDWETDRVAVLETNLDDCTGEILGHFLEVALAAGALDVFYTQVQMKKKPAGVLLTVLCTEADANKFHELIMRETTAFGVRQTVAERHKLHREFTQIATPSGDITMKIGRIGAKVVQSTPEFESARKIAAHAHEPIKVVYEKAIRGANVKK